MNITEQRNGDAIAFIMEGDFTFRDHTVFDACRESIETGAFTSAHFDMTDVETVQTAAVGMLLLLADVAKQHKVRLSMTPPKGPARRLLALCRVDKAFPSAG
ncbi:MAG: STAS domain-containing protein [Pseudomonadota bacterium]